MRNGHEMIDATTIVWIDGYIYRHNSFSNNANYCCNFYDAKKEKKSNARMTICTLCYLNRSHFDFIQLYGKCLRGRYKVTYDMKARIVCTMCRPRWYTWKHTRTHIQAQSANIWRKTDVNKIQWKLSVLVRVFWHRKRIRRHLNRVHILKFDESNAWN